MFAAALLTVVLGLVVYAAFFEDFGPISNVCQALLVLTFIVLIFLAQFRWAPRSIRELQEFGEGPLQNTLADTQTVLEEQRLKSGGRRDVDEG